MMEKILQYNDSDSSLYVEIESYLCVSYIDILGEKHRIYYLTDVFESKLTYCATSNRLCENL